MLHNRMCNPEFGSPCSPRSTLFAHDLNRHGLQRVAPFDHVPFQLWDSCCHQMNVFGFYSFPQRVAPFYHDLGLDLVGSIGNF